MAAITGALAPETQDSVWTQRYAKEGDDFNGLEFEIIAKNQQDAIGIFSELKKAGVDKFSFDKENNRFLISADETNPDYYEKVSKFAIAKYKTHDGKSRKIFGESVAESAYQSTIKDARQAGLFKDSGCLFTTSFLGSTNLIKLSIPPYVEGFLHAQYKGGYEGKHKLWQKGDTYGKAWKFSISLYKDVKIIGGTIVNEERYLQVKSDSVNWWKIDHTAESAIYFTAPFLNDFSFLRHLPLETECKYT